MDMNNDTHTTYIQIEDVYEFSTSCYDPKLSHWNPFYRFAHTRFIFISTIIITSTIFLIFIFCLIVRINHMLFTKEAVINGRQLD